MKAEFSEVAVQALQELLDDADKFVEQYDKTGQHSNDYWRGFVEAGLKNAISQKCMYTDVKAIA
jgi:hypothetical protein